MGKCYRFEELQYFNTAPVETRYTKRQPNYYIKFRKSDEGADKIFLSKYAMRDLGLGLDQADRNVEIYYKSHYIIIFKSEVQSCLVALQGLSGIINQTKLANELYAFSGYKSVYDENDMDFVEVTRGNKTYYGIQIDIYGGKK